MGIELLGEKPEVVRGFQARLLDRVRNAIEVRRRAGVRQINYGIQSHKSANQEIEQRLTCR